MHHYKSCLRLAAALLLAALPLTGCGSDEPSADHLALTLEQAFARSQAVEVDDVEPEWIETGEARLEGKTALTLRLKEDSYLPAELSEALAALKIESAETGLLRQARATAEAQAEPLRSALLEKAPPSLENQRFIKQAEKKGDEFTAEAAIRAQKGANGWDLEILNVSQARPLTGRARSALPAEALLVGSPEAKTLVNENIAAIRAYAEQVDKAAAEATRSLTEAKAQKRAELLAALKPGTVYLGTLERPDKSIGESGLVVEEAEAATGVIKGYAFNEDPRKKNPFMGTIREGETPLLFNISTDRPGMMVAAELDLADGRLVGALTVTEQDSSGRQTYRSTNAGDRLVVSWGLAGQKALEAKIAAMTEKDTAQQKRQDDYQAALAATIAPGQSFQGVWTYDGRRGEIGLYIETVAANGLSCAGYLFDPTDRFLRKTFTATVNREFEAESPLTVTAASGQGLPYSDQLTDTQRSWLRDDSSYSLPLSLKDGGWSGQTSGNYAVTLAPVPDFAALLAQDQAAVEAHQAALAKAAAPGQAFQGVWAYRDQRGDLGLYIETAAAGGQSRGGFLFDPADRSKRKPFTATVNTDIKAPVSLTVVTTYGAGVRTAEPTLSQETWLRDNIQDTLQLTLKDGGWTGRSNNHTVELTPVPDFADLLAQDQAAEQQRLEAEKAAEQQRLEAEKAAVSPNAEYAGTWQRWGNAAGELGLKMLTLSDSGVTFTAVLFDPADPATVWQYNGAVTKNDEGNAVFTLTPLGSRNNTTTARQAGTTHYMLNDRSSNNLRLTITAEGLSGSISYGPELSLKKITAAASPATATAPTATEAPAAVAAALAARAPEAPAPTAAPAQAVAPATATAVAPAYPPLVLASNGKPKIAAHRVSQEGKAVSLALQALAPGKQLTAVRIDNLGGIQAHFRSDGLEGAAPLTVSLDGERRMAGLPSLNIAAGEAEILLTLSLEDNGAFAGGATEFRVTVFFADGERAMCFLK